MAQTQNVPQLPDVPQNSNVAQQCGICREDIVIPKELPCKHNYCFLCIKAYFDLCQHNGEPLQCPTCKSSVPNNFLREPARIDLNMWRQYFVHTPTVRWYYSSREQNKWWAYDPKNCEFIERRYQEFRNDDRLSVCRIFIATDPFIIDFVNMTQNPKDLNNLVRDIRRCSGDSDPNETVLTKGIAGLIIKTDDPI
jgi:hypothetical protein